MPISEVRNKILIYPHKNIYNKNNLNLCNLNKDTNKKDITDLNLAYQSIVSFKNQSLQGLNKYIVGFEEEKNILKSKLINPLKSNSEVIPFLFVLNSMDKENSESFLNGIKEELKSNCIIKKIPNNIAPNEFLDVLNNETKVSSQAFSSTGKRTILMVDNIEKYINATPFELNNELFTIQDKEIVKNYGLNKEIVALIKHMADYCSKTPNQDKNGAALVIVSNSVNPHLIDPELLKRKEKLEAIVIPYSDSKTIEKIIHNELNKQIQSLNLIKKSSDVELQELELPYSLVKSFQNENIIKKLHTKKIDIKTIPTHIIAKYCNFNNLNGVHSISKIKEIIQTSFYKYLESNSDNYTDILLEEFILSPKDINHETYIKQNKIKNFVENKANKAELTLKSINRFLKLSKMNLITKEKSNKIMTDFINKEIEYIKGNLKNNADLIEIFEDANVKKNPVIQNYKQDFVNNRVLKLNNGKFKFFYGERKDEYVNLYIGSFGWNKNTLWIDSSKNTDIKLVKHFINQLKNIKEFANVSQIEFALDKSTLDFNCFDTGRLTLEYKKIYCMEI